MRLRWLAMTLVLGGLAVAAAPSLKAQEAPAPTAPPVGARAAEDSPAQRPDTKWDVPPKVIKRVDPTFSEEARRKRISGRVTVHVFIDDKGNVRDVQVTKGVGHGLDEEAVKAVRQYEFQPAMRGGVPIACDLYVMVRFQIFR